MMDVLKKNAKKVFLAAIVVLSGAFLWFTGAEVDFSQLLQDALSGEGSDVVQQVEDFEPPAE